MPVPRWFDSTLLEAQQADHPVDYGHLGEQFGMKIEEVIPLRSLKTWWTLVKDWNDGTHIDKNELGDKERAILDFLEKECPDCLGKIPDDKRSEFLKGLWKKRS
ncbi:MAG TPA: hypothetical protein VEK15_23805 [Vicinamibacteria bacterium]|nr:hypothetical protein [Vicinamibacteria bacterium]